jgi:hypothetical protein
VLAGEWRRERWPPALCICERVGGPVPTWAPPGGNPERPSHPPDSDWPPRRLPADACEPASGDLLRPAHAVGRSAKGAHFVCPLCGPVCQDFRLQPLPRRLVGCGCSAAPPSSRAEPASARPLGVASPLGRGGRRGTDGGPVGVRVWALGQTKAGCSEAGQAAHPPPPRPAQLRPQTKKQHKKKTQTHARRSRLLPLRATRRPARTSRAARVDSLHPAGRSPPPRPWPAPATRVAGAAGGGATRVPSPAAAVASAPPPLPRGAAGPPGPGPAALHPRSARRTPWR